MALLPLMIAFDQRAVLIVGGGGVAYRRAQKLCQAGAQITVIAPKADPRLNNLSGVRVIPRAYKPQDLDRERLSLLVVATDDAALNQSVADDGRARGLLVAIADAPAESDVQFMASGRRGDLTLCVHTGGASATAATRIRDELIAAIDPAWPVLLEQAAGLRPIIQARVADPSARQTLLKQTVDEAALRTLRDSGIHGLKAHHRALLQRAGIPINLERRLEP